LRLRLAALQVKCRLKRIKILVVVVLDWALIRLTAYSKLTGVGDLGISEAGLLYYRLTL